jgi:hypothetical protein
MNAHGFDVIPPAIQLARRQAHSTCFRYRFPRASVPCPLRILRRMRGSRPLMRPITLPNLVQFCSPLLHPYELQHC